MKVLGPGDIECTQRIALGSVRLRGKKWVSPKPAIRNFDSVCFLS